MKLYANGDSWTLGEGLNHPDHPGPYNLRIQDNINWALAHSWPAKLAALLDVDHVNHGESGGSNDRIVRTTLDYICSNDCSDLLIIIGWSHPYRREIHCIDYQGNSVNDAGSRWRKLLPNADMMKNIPGGSNWNQFYIAVGWNDYESYLRFFNQVMLLSSFLRQRAIPYIFFNAFEDPIMASYSTPISVRHLCDNVSWSDFMSSNGNTDGWCQRLINEHNQALPCRHPTEIGHQIIAAAIFAELKKRNMI